MNILLVGGAGAVINTVINKLNKEGHRVYVLTGNENKIFSYHKVFEKYDFSYESPSLKEIFESVNPDVVLFMGAYDTNFDWMRANEESVRYLAGLVNVLLSFFALGKGRFIYLSSEEVYDGSYPNDIMEPEPTSAKSVKAMAIIQGEKLCMNYKETMGMDIVLMRLDHLYCIPGSRKEVNQICSKMCLEALKNGSVTANGKNEFSLLYVSDAVEFIYKIMVCDHHRNSLYHVSSGEIVNELDVAQMVQKSFGKSVKIIDHSVGENHRLVLSGKVFEREFDTRIFHSLENIVKETVVHMKRHASVFLEAGDRGLGLIGRLKQRTKEILRILVPFVENLVCFIPFFMLNNRAVGSQYFANLDFYLLYVLLFAIVHGQMQAVFSAILAVAGYCFRQMYGRSGFDVLLDYNTYVWIAQLFILGMVVGYMKDRLKIVDSEGKREIDYLEGQLDDIHDINLSNVRMKNILETQLVNQNDSFGKIYEITSSLEQYAPEEVLFYAAEVVARLVNSEDVAIYTVANGTYARLFSATSKTARQLGNSIDYTKFGDLYTALLERKVYINKELEEKYPLMANAIYAEDEMQLILMIWGIPWERMNLNQSNMLMIVSYLIQNAVIRANRYQQALEDKRYVGGTNILEREAFFDLVKAYLGAKKKGLTECTILQIDKVGKSRREIGAALTTMLRQSDYLGELEDGNLYVLLSNTGKEGALYVKKRFEEAGYTVISKRK
ncbi:MAG: NAD-dependent epimerase/dehydratase family protein [Lachnospiraceae bacterium]|nr:NAD-dependent epimerase/dehydratase family protein [Lachnospiraceae bacterium]